MSRLSTDSNGVTIHDVARASGVSFSTVSLVLNRKGNISQATRERVFEAARSLGYSANPMARALRGQSSMILGASMRTLDNDGVYSRPGVDYFARLLASAWERALGSGYGLVLTGRDLTDSELLAPVWVDGYIVEDPLEDDPFIERLLQAKVPLVTIGWPPGRASEVSWVSTSDVVESDLVLQHLKECGAETIALVSGSERTSWHIEGERHYTNYASEAGFTPQIIQVPEVEGVAGGQYAGAQLLAQAQRPDAILCHTGRHAAGVVLAARESGIDVPSKLLVAACNDSAAARNSTPPITTIDLLPDQLGALAVDLLTDVISNPGEPRHRLVDGQLIVRRSTREVPF